MAVAAAATEKEAAAAASIVAAKQARLESARRIAANDLARKAPELAAAAQKRAAQEKVHAVADAARAALGRQAKLAEQKLGSSAPGSPKEGGARGEP